jgi:hypothetical protein
MFQQSQIFPYNVLYPNVVITGTFPLFYQPRIKTIQDLKYNFYYNAGLPKISSTPLGINSLYNRNPIIDQGSLQTRRI